MALTDRPQLSPEERRMSIAKYYELPLYPPGPRETQLLRHMPLDPQDALPPERLLDLLMPEGYLDAEYGYCTLPNGAGYMAMYFVYPYCTPKMIGWWFRWVNVIPRTQPAGTGNLKYKLWCPPDHFIHAFNNGKDLSQGQWAIESIDLGEGDEPVLYRRVHLDAKQYGLSAEREQEFRQAGCWVDLSNVTFHSPADDEQYPGNWLWLTVSRPCAQGGVEMRTRLWMGYGAKDGKLYYDDSTPEAFRSEETMRKFLIHTTVEHQHLAKLLPKLYEEYSERPDDEV